MKAKTHQDVFVGIFIILCSVGFFIINRNLPAGAKYFPDLLLIILSLMAAWISFDGIRKTRAASESKPIKNSLTWTNLKVPLIALLYITVYVILFRVVGYFIATVIFMIAMMHRFGVKSWKQILLITFGFVLVIYLLMVKQLHVPIDFGYLEQWILMG